MAVPPVAEMVGLIAAMKKLAASFDATPGGQAAILCMAAAEIAASFEKDKQVVIDNFKMAIELAFTLKNLRDRAGASS